MQLKNHTNMSASPRAVRLSVLRTQRRTSGLGTRHRSRLAGQPLQYCACSWNISTPFTWRHDLTLFVPSWAQLIFLQLPRGLTTSTILRRNTGCQRLRHSSCCTPTHTKKRRRVGWARPRRRRIGSPYRGLMGRTGVTRPDASKLYQTRQTRTRRAPGAHQARTPCNPPSSLVPWHGLPQLPVALQHPLPSRDTASRSPPPPFPVPTVLY